MWGRKEVTVQSDFAAARRHIEEAARLLTGEDELSAKSRQALAILIDAFMAAEYSGGGLNRKVIDLEERRRQRPPGGGSEPARA